jgi:hypothetical protein
MMNNIIAPVKNITEPTNPVAMIAAFKILTLNRKMCSYASPTVPDIRQRTKHIIAK